MNAEDGESSPHAAYDRYWRRVGRGTAILRRVGQFAFYLIALALASILMFLFVASVIDLAQPTRWGTFTQTDCEPRLRGGCRPVGTWVSEDATEVRRGVYLDGWVGSDGTTRAGYRQDGIISDETNNIVHAPGLTAAGPWVSGGILIWWVGYSIYKSVQWGDIRLPSRRRAQLARLDPDESFPTRRARRDAALRGTSQDRRSTRSLEADEN